MEKLNLKAKNIIDVGVGKGNSQLYKLFPNAFRVLIDPPKESEKYSGKYIDKYGKESFNYAAGESHKKETITVEKDGIGASSILERTEKTKRDGKNEKKKVIVKIDEIVKNVNTEKHICIKVDAEGYEMKTLLGAKKTLNKTEFFIVEVPLYERFVNKSKTREISKYLSNKGFSFWIFWEYIREFMLV